MRITDIAKPTSSVRCPLEGCLMKERIGLAFVAAAIAYAMLPMALAGIASKEKVVRAKMDLPAPVATPNLPFEVLKPLY